MKCPIASQVLANIGPPADAARHLVELVATRRTDEEVSLQIRRELLPPHPSLSLGGRGRGEGALMEKSIEAANVTGFRLHRPSPRPPHVSLSPPGECPGAPGGVRGNNPESSVSCWTRSRNRAKTRLRAI